MSPASKKDLGGGAAAIKWMFLDALMFATLYAIIDAQVTAVSPFVALFLRYLFGIPLIRRLSKSPLKG